MNKLQSGLAVFEVLLVAMIVGIIGGTGWYVLRVKNSGKMSVSAGPKDRAILKVDTDPAGIDVAGTPHCDSKKVGKNTPYDCLVGTAFTTTLTAQDKLTINGQGYAFKTWDGCSEANANKKICKVKVKLGQVVTAKVSYEKSAGASSANSATLGCPASSTYIIKGPQTFVPEKSEKLVLYNSSRDYRQSTYAQFWSGNICKEIPLNKALKATKNDGELNSGFALAASSFVTQSSQRTTIPSGGHAYITAMDKGSRDFQPIEAIFRDDGSLTIDEAGLVKKFSQIPDTTFNPPFGFCGWTDSHTVLLNIQETPVGPGGNVYYYDLDMGTISQNATHPACPY